MGKKDFYELAQNRNLYRVLKPLMGELSYARLGDMYYSDTLYEREYNISQLVIEGVLKQVNEPFEWQKELVGKNEKTVYNYCPECKTFGINMSLENKCGNCNYPKTITYYDALTIDNNMKLL